ncbi:MAG: hypothetical protein ACI83I_000006 [Bacteroidia bacterium]|jgi:uncharacterized protein YbjT (DUF2867 family)
MDKVLEYAALVIGHTGLIGNQLVDQLIKDPKCTNIRCFGRRGIPDLHHEKLETIITNFENLSDISDHIKGTVLFSAMGTTIRTAGSKEAQYKVDVTYPLEFARLAVKNGVKSYVLVSSMGAKSKSDNFYSKIKGEMEDAVKMIKFNTIHIYRPSILDGDRKENRVMEKIGIRVMRQLACWNILTKYRPMKDYLLAAAMIKGFTTKQPSFTKENQEIYDFLAE